MADLALPDQLYNKRTLFTLSGSSVSVWLFTIVIGHVFEFKEEQRWIGLLVALVLSFIGALQSRKMNLSQGTVAFFNALLIYVTAVGLDSINHGVGKADEPGKDQAKIGSLIPFLASDPWWTPVQVVSDNRVLRAENDSLTTANLSLVRKHTQWVDSLSSMTTKACSCDAQDREIARLKQELGSKSRNAGANVADAPVLSSTNSDAAKKDLIKIINDLIAKNDRALKYTDIFLDPAYDKPLTRQQNFEKMSEDAFTLHHSLLDYQGDLKKLRENLH
jgi:hypothetical protein